MALNLTITNEQKIKVTLNPVTDAGKPAQLDGAPVWEVLSGASKVVAAADGLSAYLISDDSDLTQTVYQVSGDADLGSGVETISDTITLTITHANAKNIGVVAGTPETK